MMAMLARPTWPGKHAAICAAIVAAVLAFVDKPAAAQQAGACPPSKTPIKLNFSTRAPTPVYNHRLTVSGIANLLQKQGQRAPAGQRALGITLTKTVLGIQGATAAVRRGNGFCVYVTSVDVDFGWSSVEVYVPSDFPRGSCQYNVIMDHENQHIAINRGVLKEFAPLLRARIEKVLAGTKPTFTRSSAGSADAAVGGIQAQLAGLLKEFENQQIKRNAGIDSPSNYAALSTMCKDWD